MRLKLGQYIVKLEKLENEELIKSKLTENELHNFSYTIPVRKTSLEDFEKTLKSCKDGGIYSLDDDDNVLKEYRVSNIGYSYTDNSSNKETIYSYKLHFEEVENLKLETLKISELSIKPYKYEQEYDNGIIITASAKLLKEDMKKFVNIQDGERYFNVVRFGINEKEIKMRFGQVIWSENDDFFKVYFILVEECYDSINNFKGPFQPEMGNIMRMLAYQQNLNNELINLLLTKSIVNDEEIEDIKIKSEKCLNDTHRLFYKVKDIDEF